MSFFSHPVFLFAIIPIGVLMAILYRIQLISLNELREIVSPTQFTKLSLYRHRGLHLHWSFLCLMVCLPIIVAATPACPSKYLAEDGSIIILLDSSYSMAARDATTITGKKSKTLTRFAASRAMIAQCIKMFPKRKIGLISFSGKAALISTPTLDHESLDRTLQSLSLHSYVGSGTSFYVAIEMALEQMLHSGLRSDLILISDGEQSGDQGKKNPDSMIRKQNLRVYTIGVGSSRGREISIMNPNDPSRGTDGSRIAARFPVRLNETELRKIASISGGKYYSGSSTSVAIDLQKELRKRQYAYRSKHGEGSSLTSFLLILFAIFFTTETMILPGLRQRGLHVFRMRNLRKFFLASFLILTGLQCENDFYSVYRSNMKGMDAMQTHRYELASMHFQKTIQSGYNKKFALYNMGTAQLSLHHFAQAHKYFAMALRRDATFAKALFNDGYNLQAWGLREYFSSTHARSCMKGDARHLWTLARHRFIRASEAGLSDALRKSAKRNARIIQKDLELLHKLEQKCHRRLTGNLLSRNKPMEKSEVRKSRIAAKPSDEKRIRLGREEKKVLEKAYDRIGRSSRRALYRPTTLHQFDTKRYSRKSYNKGDRESFFP